MIHRHFIFNCSFLLCITGCAALPTLDDIIPDRRTEYKKSESLPDLEVPPDLTTEVVDDPLLIPDEESTSLSEFERQKSRRQSGTGADLAAGGIIDEQMISIRGNTTNIWPDLREFWANKGYAIDIDDIELGVMETDWLEQTTEGGDVRDKFKIFLEPGGTADNIVLFVSNERQGKLVSSDGGEEWVALGNNVDMERAIVGELNLYFNVKDLPAGTETSSTAANISSSPSTKQPKIKQAEILNLDEEKVYLSLPEEFSLAWTQTEDVLNKAGLFIQNQERSKGLYYVLYYDESEAEEEGLLSKLKFWGDDESEGEEFQISLTGVGDKTELVVLDDKGDWADYQKASRILTLLKAQFNSRFR